MCNRFCVMPPEPRRVWTHEEKIRLLDMKLGGWSLCQLATRYDVPPYEIREALEDITREVSLDQARCKSVSFRIKPVRGRPRCCPNSRLKRYFECLFKEC